jgi:hypothetical protein
MCNSVDCTQGCGGGPCLLLLCSSKPTLPASPILCRTFCCRGDQATAAEVACFGHPALYSSARRHASPLAVAASNTRLGRQQMLATLLSNDQASCSRGGG